MLPPVKVDVLVVGAGPAGMMAAGQAARQNVRVVLLEKMQQPGLKLRITGKRRCNLTNELEIKDFITKFGKQGPFLWQSFAQFFNDDLVQFFTDLGIQCSRERGGRIFPADGDAVRITNALLQWVKSSGVQIQLDSRLRNLDFSSAGIIKARISKKADEQAFLAQTVIIATGGASYPGTGSTGDGYPIAKAMGHSIVPQHPALVPLNTAFSSRYQLNGLHLRNVKLSLWNDGRLLSEQFGEMDFTRAGINGPIVLQQSKTAVSILDAGKALHAHLDMKPALLPEQLDKRLQRDLAAKGKVQLKEILKGLLPIQMIPVLLDQCDLQGSIPAHQVDRKQRLSLVLHLKAIEFQIQGHRGFKDAIVTSGGIALDGIDPRTMASRIQPSVYFAGEILDLDGPTGGYNLQVAFSTGWLAGNSAAQAVIRNKI